MIEPTEGLVDPTKVDPTVPLTPERLRTWVEHDLENTCHQLIEALQQRETHRARVEELEVLNAELEARIAARGAEESGTEI